LQHQKDLEIYRRAHQEWRNRYIHYIMIPMECFAFLEFVSILAGPLCVWLVGFLMAVLSTVVTTDVAIGTLCCIFLSTSCWLSTELIKLYGMEVSLVLASVCWVVAWVVQVGIGHFLFERNKPNVANMSEVSYLAMLLSVLIAWSS